VEAFQCLEGMANSFIGVSVATFEKLTSHLKRHLKKKSFEARTADSCTLGDDDGNSQKLNRLLC
jgi:hypothetical protein